MLRTILGILAGIVAGFAAVLAAQALVNLIYPLPAGLDVLDREQVSAAFSAFPPQHFALILLTYLIGGFVGAYVARLIARRDWALWVPAALIALTAAINVFTYPHPLWAQIGGIVAPLIGAWLAARLPATRRVEGAPAERADAEI
ncbi:MAG TPA: hypothetical protein VNT77_05200 [Allosphingosinicella sp.]|nr:hypothetical protein [Allosphingosinicella sp.]